MSVNRENVVWQAADETWSIGFYRCYNTGDPSDPDFDFEWDVDYDFDAFEWCSTGHRSEQAAIDAWDGANPGGHTIGGDVARLDAMVEALRARVRAR